MTAPAGVDVGFIAISRSDSARDVPDLGTCLASIGIDAPIVVDRGGVQTATWGEGATALDGAQPLVLCRGPRRREHDVSPPELRALLRDDDGLAEMLPAFAAADMTDRTTVVAAADVLGFRHLYHGARDGFAVLSTSGRAVGACMAAGVDREAIAIQSLLGWQLGQRTLFEGVQKLAPGELATLSDGRVVLRVFRRSLDDGERGLDASVNEAASMLRGYVGAYLDDHPDAILQLTGGQDSRLLLSAVPPARRQGLRSVTLGLPGNPDVEIAATLSRRYGLEHEVLTLDGIDALAPEEADRRCVEAARQLECMADPLAHAALTFAEARAVPGPRLSGLGGEVARGFYYFGRVGSAPVTRERVERLARWRMFANESVAADALDPEFAAWARGFAVDDLYSLCSAGGRDWMSATDDLYLDQRMQRWAGVTETAVCTNREVVNPMLDDRFIEIARGLHPRHKRNSMFLSRLQVALDEDLARIPLDGRPAPVTYAHTSIANSTRQAATTVGKIGRKVHQRVLRITRPPAGGTILAGKVVEHWRANGALLDPVRQTGIFRPDWLDTMLAGGVEPEPSSVALLTNLRVALSGAPERA